MYFTFSEETSYGVDATSQDFVVDLISEEVISNVNYNKMHQFNYPTSKSRLKGVSTHIGRIALEFTYGNLGWNSLFKTLIGSSVILADFAFAKSSERWNIITGYLSTEITSSQTSFIIEEYKAGEFDNVDGVIIGREYIAVSSIANGVVSASSRASESTTATSHAQYTLVYGVVASGGKNLEIISRYRSGFCYSLPTSLTTLIHREGDYFEFTGSQFSDFVFNAGINSIEASFEMMSRNARIIQIANPDLSVDNNQMVSPLEINCYSMNQDFKIQKLYMQVSNTLTQLSSKFMDTTYGKISLSNHSAYGQFTLDDETSQGFLDYINNETKNVSITMCKGGRQFDEAYVFGFNQVKYGTMLHLLYSSIDMKGDSVPFFSFDPDGFVLMIQTNS